MVLVLATFNLGLGLLQQLLLIHLLGGARSDVMFSAQAPFLVCSAVAAAIIGNVFTPFLAAEAARGSGTALRPIHRPTLATVGALSLVMLAAMAMLASYLFAPTIALAPQFGTAMVVFCAGGAAAAAMALYGAHLHAVGRAVAFETVQLLGNLSGLILAWPMTMAFGVLGASVSLALRPVACALVLFALCHRGLSKASSEAVNGGVGAVLKRGWRMVPSHLLLKSTPVIDRALLSHAAPATLSAYVIAGQIVAAGLALYERAATRQLLVQLGRVDADERYQLYRSRFRFALRLATGAACAGALLALLAALLIGDREWLPVDPRILLLLAVFCVLQTCAGALSQTAASYFYASGRTGLLSVLSATSWAVSVAARALLFVVFGLAGFLVGTLLYQLLNTVLFDRTARPRALHG